MQVPPQISRDNKVWKLIEDLSQKKGITELVINESKCVFVERAGRFIQLNVAFSKEEVEQFIGDVAKLNGKKCDQDHPILDATLPDGSRFNAIVAPYSADFPAVTIRKFLHHINKFDDDPEIFGLGSQWIEFLKAIVSARCNIVISGGTGAGKTTLLNLLLNEVSFAERVVTIEDTLELRFSIPNLVRLEYGGKELLSKSDLTARDLVKNTLRMRPDRIIIGEIRGGEFFDLLSAMNTGHDGSMTSIHANSPAECFGRMESLYLMSGHHLPNHVVRRQIGFAVDFIIQVTRNREGERVVEQIQEVTGMEGETISSQTVASRDQESGRLEFSGATPTRMAKISRMGGIPIDFFK